VRLLVRAGPDGMAAGAIGEATGTVQNTLSSHLKILSEAGLIGARRDGRSIVYSTAFEAVGDLLAFLVEDCCNGDPSVCAKAFERIGRLSGGGS
jgi:DNA-binding transcriptional ArsR family regulator